jgi:quercetin dioxygenase-like cupin family protein
VRFVDFRPEVARTPAEELLENVTRAPLTAPLARGGTVQAACFRLAPGGRIARHPASVPQILAVVEGSGWVSGSDGHEQLIEPGIAVFWDTGEIHETWTESGMTTIIVEGEGVRPYAPA